MCIYIYVCVYIYIYFAFVGVRMAPCLSARYVDISKLT